MNRNTLENEVLINAIHSSGAGGQNVNKVATKIQLSFHISNSTALSEEEKTCIFQKYLPKSPKKAF